MPRVARPWTASDLKKLKSLAGRRKPAAIATALRRSPAAVTFKAWQQGISLAMAAPKTKKKRAGRKARPR
jgi:hypothetical protein